MKRFLSVYIILLGCIALSENVAAQDQRWTVPDSVTYLWPTNASTYLSATFAETRGRHFHSAVDIGTWGVEGYEVYASRSGYLYRASVSAVGYGNAVYLQHNDGSYTVYAHLQDFHPEIRSVVDSIRFQNYSFLFDEVLIDHGIYFDQGDVIGLSGSTGVGPPHLHVEVRSPSNTVYNPLLFGFAVPDNIPPQFRTLSVEPKSPETNIEGSRNIFTRNAEPRRGIYDFGTVNVTGPVGLGVNVFDRADGRPNVYAVYELEMTVNGEPFFHSRVDSLSFRHTHQMFLDRVYPILLASRRGFQRLYVKDGNQLPFYTTNETRGVLDLPAGTYEVEMQAADFFGNKSTARLTLVMEQPEPNVVVRNRDQKKPLALPETKQGAPENWNWHNNWVETDLSHIRVQQYGSFTIPKLEINDQRALTRFTDSEIIKLSGDTKNYLLHRIYPNQKNVLYSVDQRLSAHFQPGSVYDTMSVGLDWNIPEHALASLTVYPNHEPIFRPVTLRYLLAEEHADNTKLGLYYYLPRSGTYRLAETRVDGQLLESDITHFDTYYILEDNQPPEISEPRIYQRRSGRWIAAVSVTDDLSGIDYNTIQFYCNEVRGIAEYDPENDLIRYHHTDFEPLEENTVRISVADNMGNRTEAVFSIPGP